MSGLLKTVSTLPNASGHERTRFQIVCFYTTLISTPTGWAARLCMSQAPAVRKGASQFGNG